MNEVRRIYNEGEMKGYINEGRRPYIMKEKWKER